MNCQARNKQTREEPGAAEGGQDRASDLDIAGVKLPQDIETAARAKRFLELYVKDYGRYYFIYNTTNPSVRAMVFHSFGTRVVVKAVGLRRRWFKPDC